MHRFRSENWVDKVTSHRPNKWKLSSSEIGRFETGDDHLRFRDMKRSCPSPLRKIKHTDNDPFVHVADSMIWEQEEEEEEPLFTYPNAGVRSTRLADKYGRMKPKDNIYTPPKRYKVPKPVKLQPLKNTKSGLKIAAKTGRSLSPCMSIATKRSHRSLPPILTTRSDGSESVLDSRFKSPWRGFGKDGSLSQRDERYLRW